MLSNFYLPGDVIAPPPPRSDDHQHQQQQQQQPLKLTQGIRLLSPSPPSSQTKTKTNSASLTSTPTPTPAVAGVLTTDRKRTTTVLTLDTFRHRRYQPSVNDLVIAAIHHSSADYFHCALSGGYGGGGTPYDAYLAQLAFEGATKKTRPMLKPGDLVYARVVSVGVVAGGGEIELTCVNPATGKAEPDGLGPLNAADGGMMFDVSVGLAARLLVRSTRRSGIVMLEELGKKLEAYGGFEIVVGKNGRVWVNCSAKNAGGDGGNTAIRIVILIGRCLAELDEKNLEPQQQKKLVSRLLREMGLAS